MTIEPATPFDLEELCNVDVLLTSRVRQDAILRESVVNAGCFLARSGRALDGFITWDLGFFQRPFVRLLVVVARARRRGVGRALLQRVEHAAAAHGELFISTESLNAPMQALLHSLAYVPSGSIDHINAPTNPELIFYKSLRRNPP